jgi:hypothetical protein
VYIRGAHSVGQMQRCSSRGGRPPERVCVVVHAARGSKSKVAASLPAADHRSVCAWCTQREEATPRWLLLSQKQASGARVRGALNARKAEAKWLLFCLTDRGGPQERVCVESPSARKQKQHGCSSHRDRCVMHTAPQRKCQVAAPLTEAGHRSACACSARKQRQSGCSSPRSRPCARCTPRRMDAPLTGGRPPERVCVVHATRGSKCQVAAPLQTMWCTQRRMDAGMQATDRSVCALCSQREDATAIRLLLSRRQATDRSACERGAHSARKQICNVAAPLTEAGH